jgi:hypothetical protein
MLTAVLFHAEEVLKGCYKRDESGQKGQVNQKELLDDLKIICRFESTILVFAQE